MVLTEPPLHSLPQKAFRKEGRHSWAEYRHDIDCSACCLLPFAGKPNPYKNDSYLSFMPRVVFMNYYNNYNNYNKSIIIIRACFRVTGFLMHDSRSQC